MDYFEIACAEARKQKKAWELMHYRRDEILGSPEHERSRMEEEE